MSTSYIPPQPTRLKSCVVAAICSVFSLPLFSAETNLGDAAEELTGSTTNLVSAADTNRLIYDELDCDGNRNCSTVEQSLYNAIEKLIHTAFGGRSDLSTGPDGLRASLYWFSTEEAGAQGDMAANVNSSQVGSISSRLSALRSLSNLNDISLASNSNASILSGGAASDELASKWGVFANFGSIEGDKAQTEFTDAVGFDGNKISLGIDYQANSQWVLGVAGGLDRLDSTIKRTDFDVNENLKPNVAEGKTNLESTTLSAYALYHNENYYFSAIASQSSLQYDLERLIAYQSNNANVSGANALAVATSDGTQQSFGINAGISFNQGSISETIDLGYSASSTTIDAYSETGAGALNFAVDKQDINSSVLSLDGKISKVVNTKSSVLIPYLRARFIKQLDDEQYEITARYDAFDSENKFTVLSDVPETDFLVVGVGVSAILRNGVQGHLSYSSLQGAKTLTANLLNAGFRLEF